MGDIERTLTDKEIDKQDEIDGAIFNLICNLSPADSNGKIMWDIEIIGQIRDTLSAYYVSLGLCTDEEFYPSINFCPECLSGDLWEDGEDVGCNFCGWQEGQIL